MGYALPNYQAKWLPVLSPGGGAAAAGTLSGSEPELAAVRLRERQGCD